MSSRLSSAAFSPTSGLEPAPRPWVTFFAQLYLNGGLRTLKGLLVRIHADELYTAHARAGNAVHGISAAAAHTYHFYGLWSFIQQVINFKRHIVSSLGFLRLMLYLHCVKQSAFFSYYTTSYNLSLFRENFKEIIQKGAHKIKIIPFPVYSAAMSYKMCSFFAVPRGKNSNFLYIPSPLRRRLQHPRYRRYLRYLRHLQYPRYLRYPMSSQVSPISPVSPPVSPSEESPPPVK